MGSRFSPPNPVFMRRALDEARAHLAEMAGVECLRIDGGTRRMRRMRRMLVRSSFHWCRPLPGADRARW